MWVDVVVPAGVETGKKLSFEYGGVLYKIVAAVAAGQAVRLPVLTFADDGGGVAGVGMVVRMDRATRRRHRQNA